MCLQALPLHYKPTSVLDFCGFLSFDSRGHIYIFNTLYLTVYYPYKRSWSQTYG